MESVPVPKTLDTPPRFLFWDSDEVCAAVTGFSVGLVLGSYGLGVVLAFLFSWLWLRAKRGRGVETAFAMLYWLTPADFFRRVPASARRHFIG